MTDVSGIDQAALFQLVLISLSCTLILIMAILFYLTGLFDW